MRQLTRVNEPESFFKNKKKIDFYKDLRDEKGKIRDRWNYETYKSDLCKALLSMSKNECSFCGTIISETNMDIEHFLPKENFPYLSYSFENYLASCKKCNQNTKRNYYPKSLEPIKDKLGEQVLIGHIENLISYNKAEILNKTIDRIVEPGFDTVSDHLEFLPDSANYKTKTNIGKETNRMFFNHREVLDLLQKINNQVMRMIEEGSSKDAILSWSEITGYSFYIEEFYNYWSAILNPNSENL